MEPVFVLVDWCEDDDDDDDDGDDNDDDNTGMVLI